MNIPELRNEISKEIYNKKFNSLKSNEKSVVNEYIIEAMDKIKKEIKHNIYNEKILGNRF